MDTKNEWKVVKEPNTVNSYFIICGNQVIATVHEKESIANCMASAMELLNGLKFCINVLGGRPIFDEEETIKYEAAKAAIKKAT